MPTPDTQSAAVLNRMRDDIAGRLSLMSALSTASDDDAFNKTLSSEIHALRAFDADLMHILNTRGIACRKSPKIKPALLTATAKLKLISSKSPEQIADILIENARKSDPSIASSTCDAQVHSCISRLNQIRSHLVSRLSPYAQNKSSH